MDESDEFESTDEEEAEQETSAEALAERRRVRGAEPAGSLTGSVRPRRGAGPEGVPGTSPPSLEERYLGFSQVFDDDDGVGAFDDPRATSSRWQFEELAPDAGTADSSEPYDEPAAVAGARSGAENAGDDARAGQDDTWEASSSSSWYEEDEEEAAADVRKPARARWWRASGAARSDGGTGRGAGRSVPIAIVTGVGFALVALGCLLAGALAMLVLSTVVMVLAVAEYHAAMRKAGYRPATLLGLAATIGLMVGVYNKGLTALPLVLVLFLVTSMVWYLVRVDRGSPLAGISTSVLGFVWIGVLASFAALLLAPSQFPHGHGVAFMFGALVATVADDVGALAVGAWLGRHPLAPGVSPHKTWEGLIGGAVVAVALSAAITGQVHPWTPGTAALLGLVAAAVAPIDDLCESMIKRDLRLKDMGSLLPGHGGVLDRVDAILFVLPATYYLVRILHLG